MAASISAGGSDGNAKLLDRVRAAIRFKHYSLRTERYHFDWIARFIRFHRMRHPSQMGEPEVTAFLTSCASGKCGGFDSEPNLKRASVFV
jgi:Phage integrase, N-terminal SAM-like domain